MKDTSAALSAALHSADLDDTLVLTGEADLKAYADVAALAEERYPDVRARALTTACCSTSGTGRARCLTVYIKESGDSGKGCLLVPGRGVLSGSPFVTSLPSW